MISVNSPLWKVASTEVEADRFVIPRPAYLPPEVRGQDPMVPEGTDLAIWSWERETARGPVPCAIAFAGKANKPLWNYSFRSEAQRQSQIEETIKDRKALLKYKAERLEERRNFQHGLQAGDILYSSWGYDQTNINFYEVIEAGAKEVIIREVAQKTTGSEMAAEYVVPVPGKYVGPALRRRPASGGVKIDSSQRATKWDGRPKSQTAYGWGH